MSTTQLVQTPAEAFESLPGYHEDDYGPGNRSYIGWAPGGDAMWTREDRKGWGSTLYFDSWEEFKGGFGGLDDLNVVVDFYFDLTHDSRECPSCEGRGGSPEANEFERTFYSHSCLPGELAWSDRITQEDVDALVEANRLSFDFPNGKPTPDEVNAWQRGDGNRPSLGHDAINRWVMVKARCERMGVPSMCTKCEGSGHLRTSDDYLVLNLWILHPRKGSSRGVGIKRVPVEALDEVREWLHTSREIQATWWAWVDDADESSESIGAAERDRQVAELLSDIDELSNRPSQHSAAHIREVVERAMQTIHTLHTDVRGWESQEVA